MILNEILTRKHSEQRTNATDYYFVCSALGHKVLCDIIKQKQLSRKSWVNEAWLQYARSENSRASVLKVKEISRQSRTLPVSRMKMRKQVGIRPAGVGGEAPPLGGQLESFLTQACMRPVPLLMKRFKTFCILSKIYLFAHLTKAENLTEWQLTLLNKELYGR